jgi:hypothetical protein
MKKGPQETVWCGQTEDVICDNRYIFFANQE